MITLKYYFRLLLLVFLVAGCQKVQNEDISFIQSAVDPGKLSMMFDITQDNTGLVTITPNGEGAVTYDVYFGDGTVTGTRIAAGKNVKHTYAEGVYNVKVVATNVIGKTTETTQKLTVSFKAPEDLQVNAAVDGVNNFKVNVSATAKYETLFKVYFGDVTDEIPQSFLEGETVSHIYAATGTYTVKVVALSGGAATTEYTQQITIVDPLLLPVTFESSTLPYSFVNFDGGNTTVVANPQQNGINTSSKVAKMVKSAGQTWGGSWIGLSSSIDFSANKVFRMKVFSPRVGAKVLLKVENAADPGINFEKEVATTKANEWEDLAFDYSAINTANTYEHIVIIFDNGTMGDGTGNFTFLFDDIRLTNVLPNTTVNLPVNFEDPNVNYAFTNFGNAGSSVVSNPHIDANNASAKVGKLNKANGAETWAGSFLELGSPIDFSSLQKIKMKVWSPKAGITVKIKLENLADPNINTEVDAVNTIANGWEDLVFDFTGINNANNYQRLVVFFDFNVSGDGSDYYFDDIQLTDGAEPFVLPITFQSSVLPYTFTDFGGATSTVVTNPDQSGINTSTKVGQLVKANGSQVWAGSYLELASPIDFSALHTIKMKVWSPKAGIVVKFKMENFADPNINTELDATTTVANGWEELTYDFSGINNANHYQRVVVFFDFGNAGDGSTYYFDDIKLN